MFSSELTVCQFLVLHSKCEQKISVLLLRVGREGKVAVDFCISE